MKILSATEFRPHAYLVTLLYLVLPSLPLALFAHSLALLRPGYINLEYLCIGMIGVFLSRRIVFVLLFLESGDDFLCSIRDTYQFSFGDLLSSFRYLPVLPTVRIFEISAVIVLVISVCVVLALARPRAEERLRTAGNLLFLIIIISFIASLTGQLPLWRKDTRTAYRVVRCPDIALIKRIGTFNAVAMDMRRGNSAAMPSASSQAIAFLNHSVAIKSPDVVLVVVESWGLPLDLHLSQALTAPYDNPIVAGKYHVAYGTVPFYGGTIAGESRELCRSGISYGIIDASEEQLKNCLPDLFHLHNYQTISIHGNTGFMFQRNIWYRTIGFDKSWFLPDLDNLGMPRCGGAFEGTCDASIAAWIGSSLLSADMERPKFIYWLTLNSHLPVPPHPYLPDDGVCATQPELRNSASVCSWFRIVRTIHQSIQKLALGMTDRPVIFVVVGDHAPPFADLQLRQEFSPTVVPYVTLTPITVRSRASHTMKAKLAQPWSN